MPTAFSLLGSLMCPHNKKSQWQPMPCTSSLPTPLIYSTSSRIHIWGPVGGLRWSFSAETAYVGCFSRGAPSLMFDVILNAMLCLRRFPPLGLHKEILNSPCLLILLIHTRHKNKNINFWTDPTSSFHLRRTLPLGR